MPTLTQQCRCHTGVQAAPAHRQSGRERCHAVQAPGLCRIHRSANRAVWPRMLLDVAWHQPLATGTQSISTMNPADGASAEGHRSPVPPLRQGLRSVSAAGPCPLNAVWIRTIRKRICKVTKGPHSGVRPSYR